jgi:hypothetical protein
MDLSLEALWDWEERRADELDARSAGANTWVPSNLGALVRAVRRTPLGRWAPITSHACFLLTADTRWDSEWSPAFVARTRTDGYSVHHGPISDYTGHVVPTLVTSAAEEAAAELATLLLGWRPRS